MALSGQAHMPRSWMCIEVMNIMQPHIKKLHELPGKSNGIQWKLREESGAIRMTLQCRRMQSKE
jgi:hypothetical protein